MSVHDFLTPEVLANVPEGNEAAFSYIARAAHRVLAKKGRDATARDEWSEIEDAQYTYTSVILNAAKRYQIAPLSTLPIPKRSRFSHDVYLDLNNDIEGYLSQLLLSSVEADRSFSVNLSPDSKSRLRTLVAKAKEAIEGLDISPSRKEALHSQLRKFEEELERRRVNYAVVMAILTHLASGVGGGAAEAMISKLIVETVTKVGVDKSEEVKQKASILISHQAIPALVLLRADEPSHVEDDEEIPF